MSLFTDPLTYIFYPNPGNASWDSQKAFALIIACGLLVVASFVIKYWRKRQQNPVTRKLSRSWSVSAFWFGIIGLILVLARLETISYVSMRLWWGVWAAAFIFYLYVQVRLFRARHYEVMPKERSDDPRERYLPQRKKRK